jgi:hypothetical protein
MNERSFILLWNFHFLSTVKCSFSVKEITPVKRDVARVCSSLRPCGFALMIYFKIPGSAGSRKLTQRRQGAKKT